MKHTNGSRHEGKEKRRVWRSFLPAGLWSLFLTVVVTGWILSSHSFSHAQGTPISTPDAEGNIYVVVQPNDALWSIAARSGLTLEELLQLNGIEEDTVFHPGDLLLVGRSTPPATPTSDIPTVTLPPPTPGVTATPLRTAICMMAFEDINRDGAFDAEEPLRAEVAFTVFNDETVVENYITDGVSEPYCLEGLTDGTYHVTRSIAHNEILTTQGDWAMTLTYGSELNLAFGSYLQGESVGIATPELDIQFETRIAVVAEATPTVAVESNKPAIADTPLIMVLLGIGVIALLLGVGVLIFWIAYSRYSNN
ncbi:MAG: LysM peptidoglycan-binding domain-containing protein [Chloroflexi bacterium]|jgi:hypothetical protein|nr:LysM peptidoglycan-binding domain-containing protein [Chloroflexota bacterium]